jgi:hypothetical protein
LKRWGAWLYLITTFSVLPIYFMFGFDVRHPIDQIFDDIYRSIPGLIIGLAFFSDAIPKRGSKQDVTPKPDPLAVQFTMDVQPLSRIPSLAIGQA